MIEIALVENVQREDLNPIEAARGYAALIERLGLTQQEAASRLGKSRSGVANILRLLELPLDLQDLVSRGTLSAGHARALLALHDVEAQRALARRVVQEQLSVREVERAVRSALGVPTTRSAPETNPHLDALAETLKQHLGTRVALRPGRGGRGKIVIDFFSADELERLLGLLTGRASARPE